MDNRGGDHLGGTRPGPRFSAKPKLSGLPVGSGIWERLQPRQQTFLLRLAQGGKAADVAREMEIPSTTYHGWRKSAWWHQGVEEAVTRTVQSPLSMIAPRIPQALLVYDALLQKMDFRPAKDLLDRALGKPMVRYQAEVRGEIVINFVRRSEQKEEATEVEYEVE